LLGVVLLAILLGSAEVGYRLGRRARASDDAMRSQAAIWEGALLGLLALLIGFTFAMAVTRFDARRELILDEANAIEMTLRRADFLEAPAQREIEGLLGRYVRARVRFYDAGASLPRTEAAERETAELQQQLWPPIVSAARSHPGSEMAALFVESASELYQMANRRRAALDNHVPATVLVVLLVVAAVGVAATGYSCGLLRRRLRLGLVGLPLLISLVVVLVFDLDHPRAGFIQAGQGPMLRLQQRL
jgi:hypothetical protein